MAPIVKELKTEYSGKVEIILVNCRDKDGSKLANKENIRSVPTMKLYDKEGKLKKTLIGGKSKADLKKELDALLK